MQITLCIYRGKLCFTIVRKLIMGRLLNGITVSIEGEENTIEKFVNFTENMIIFYVIKKRFSYF